MTCRGYDPRAVKLGKPIQRLAATIRDNSERRNFMKLFIDILKDESKAKSNRSKSE